MAELTRGAHVGQMQNSHSLMQLFRLYLHTVVSESGRTRVEHSSPPIESRYTSCVLDNGKH